MVDFCCCYSPEVVVFLENSLILDPDPKNGASSAPNWDVWARWHESVCLLLNIA